MSQKRHWCEYCRLYIAGTPASIAFHENGKKHREIVAQSLKDMRIRGRENRKEKQEVDREMARIEREANKAFVAQDVQGQAGKKPPPQVPADRAARLAELERQIAEDRLARRAAAGLALPTAAAGGGGGSGDGAGGPLPRGWHTATNPDGKTYYTHDETGVVQWDRPGGAAASSAAAPEPAPPAEAAPPCGECSDEQAAAWAADVSGGWQQGWSEEKGVP